MATQGIELPISLQIANLKDIAAQLKSFSKQNLLENSFSSKKIDSELSKVLTRLETISAKAQTAFTSESNFSSVEKDLSQVELGLNRIKQDISEVSFADLKLPEGVLGQIEALESRISALNNSLTAFKAAQKDKLVSNQSFLANLKTAEPSQAAKMLEKGYDELYQAIEKGMNKVNTALALKAAAYKEQQEALTQNTAGKTAVNQWGALDFIEQAFKSLPKDETKKTDIQKQMADIMNYASNDKGISEFTSFKRGAIGQSKFLQAIQSQFEFTPEEMNDIRARLKQQAEELKTTVTGVLQKMGEDTDLSKKVLFGNNADMKSQLRDQYIAQIAEVKKLEQEYKNEQTRSGAYTEVYKSFDTTNAAIKVKADELKVALQGPTSALQKYQNDLLKAAAANPQLAASFSSAAGEIGKIASAIDAGRAKLEQMNQTVNKMQGISNFINRYIGVYAIVSKVTTAIRNAFSNIKELDKSITNIAVVTNMSQSDLWGKINEYTQIAQEYGVATKDVYTVSQLFYQQGLQTNQVMSLTVETLKMAKVSGMEYEDAANAMTVAVRAFKIEMSEAQQVTDVYSALAAKFAVSSAEIANAMEKTASSAANVGMSLESTSAFISVMTQTTRESAQNIGSALKSIISRYGEMKASPTTLLNIDGEEVAFNKVDTALKSVGISIKDASGQFRDFDDVIMELAKKWDTLDNNTQRYIATVMAGNRQQSRFIALVSNYDELNRAMEVSSSAENASIVQTAKTMDSLETKAQQVKNAFSQLYLDLHLEDGLKGAYDWLTRIITTIGKLGTLKGALPTLMTVINAGFGTKSLIGTGIEAYKKRITQAQDKQDITINAQTEEAVKKINNVVEQIETPRTMPVTMQLDDSPLKDVEQRVSNLNTTVNVNANTGNTALTPVNVNDFQSILYRAQANGELNTTEGRANTLTEMGISQDSGIYTTLSSMMSSFDGASSAANEMTAIFAEATGQIATVTAEHISAIQADTQAENEHSNVVSNNNAIIVPAVQNVANNLNLIGLPAGNVSQALVSMLPPLTIAGMTLSELANQGTLVNTGLSAFLTPLNTLTAGFIAFERGADGTTQAMVRLTSSANQAAGALPGSQSGGKGLIRTDAWIGDKKVSSAETPSVEQSPTNFGNDDKKQHWYNGWFDRSSGKAAFSQKGFKGMSVATGAIRMLAPLITAAGASINDKSTDRHENSKMVTGLGNALSGAATGASIGMAAGPIGAAVGAAIGGALQGIPAIIDGWNYTIQERIAKMQEETKQAQDESLKKQAKVVDLNSSIENFKQLQKTMYNSTEDMQAYKDAMQTMAQSYPELVSSYDSAGEAIINITTAEEALSKARLEGASAAREAAIKELETAKNQLKLYSDTAVNEDTIGAQFRNAYLDIVTHGHSNADILEKLENTKAEDGSWSLDILASRLGGYLSNSNNGELDLSKTIPVEINEFLINSLKNWFSANKDTLGLQQSIYSVAGYEENYNGTWSVDALQRVVDYVESQQNKLETRIQNLNDVANSATGIETLLQQLDADTGISQDTQSKLEVGKNFQGLFNQILLEQLDTAKYSDLYDWKTAEDSDYGARATEAYKQLIEWYSGLGNVADEFLQLDYTDYTSAQQIIDKFSINNKEQQDAIIQEFLEKNQANRDRILSTIYENGELNSKLTGIKLIGGENQSFDIAKNFSPEDSSNIISKYADYFTTQIVAINDLANDGYTELASTRLTELTSLSNALSALKDKPQIQEDLLNIITSIDFSNFSSISKAAKQVQEYGQNKGLENEVAGIFSALTEAANNLIYNVNTLAQSITTSITKTTKDITTILSTNKSGVTLDSAIDTFNKMQAGLKKGTTFTDVFSYDAVLGKYVYTVDGLEAAIQQKEQELSDNVSQMSETLELNKKLLDKTGVFDQAAYKIDDIQWEDTKLSSVDFLNAANIEDPELAATYQNLVQSFLNTHEGTERTAEKFKEYIENMVGDSEEAAEQAQKLYKIYESNKKNTYYQSIDWSKLELGLDFTGLNNTLMEQLAKELNMLQEEVDDQGNKTGKWVWAKDDNGKEISHAAEDIRHKYFETLYSTISDPNERERMIADAEARVQSSIDSSKVKQASTAMEEILAGEGKALSEETIALIKTLQQNGKLANIKIDGNKITSTTEIAVDEIATSLTIYWNTVYDTIAEQNEAYAKIIIASFKESKATETLLSSGYTLDFDTIKSTFSDLELDLDNYWDAQNKQWKTVWDDSGFNQIDLNNVFTTDIFGNTAIKDWDEYLNFLESQGVTWDSLTNEAMQKYRRAYIDEKISEENSLDLEKTAASQISNLSNAKIGDRINISEIKGILGKTTDSIKIQTEQELVQYCDTLETYLSDTDWVADHGEQAAAARSFVSNIKTKFNKFEGLKGIISDKVSYSAAQTFAESIDEYGNVTDVMKGLGFTWDNYTKQFVAGVEAVAKLREKIEQVTDVQTKNELSSLLNTVESKRTTDLHSSLTSMAQNYESISYDTIKTLADAQNKDISTLMKEIGLEAVGDGTYKLDINEVMALLNTEGISAATRDTLEELIAGIADNYLSAITNASSMMMEGTTSQTDMQKFVNEFNKLNPNDTIDLSAFSYDTLFDTFKLDTDVLNKYLESQKEQLRQLGWSDEIINEYINDQTTKIAQEAISLDGLLNAKTDDERQREANKLASTIQDYLDLGNGVVEGSIESYQEYIKLTKEISSDGPTSEQRQNLEKLSKEFRTLTSAEIINKLYAGGADAVKVLQQLKPEASADEIESVYKAAVNRLNDAASEAQNLVVGQFVGTSGVLYDILANIDAVDTNGIVKEGTNMVDVFTAIYVEMKNAMGSTTADLNNIYAQLLTAQDQKNIDITDALSKGAGMSYADFGQLLSKYDIKFENYMLDHFDTVMRDGFGNIRITDWNGFAEAVFGKDWATSGITNTDEYISAFKAYNDGLIALNKNTEQAIVDEIKQIEKVKPGDWLNLSQLWTAIKEALPSDDLQVYLDQSHNNYDGAQALRKAAYTQSLLGQFNLQGASLEDGILKIGDNANLIGIAKTLESAAQTAGLEIGNGLEQVKDTVLSVLKSYAEAINKGIEGSLSGTEAADLVKKAQDLGIGKLDFTETVNGLKLSQQSAIELYYALEKVDELQGRLVFDKLSKSLQETDDHFKSTQALIEHINSIRDGTYAADSKVSKARLEQYQAELSIAQEILSVRSAQEDSSFNFMNNKIPAGQNNPLNYAKNWTKAMKAIKDAYKVKNTVETTTTRDGETIKHTRTGYMGYEDFYNVINELNNMAALTGNAITIGKKINGDTLELKGTLQSASEAIDEGIKSMAAVDTGEMMVNIGALGINLEKSGKSLKSGVESGIDAVADAQIEALDGMIAMLELIVAMEQLGDITGEDTTIDLGDIFAVGGEAAAEDNLKAVDGFTKKFDDARQKLIDYLTENTEAEQIFKGTSLKLGNTKHNMYDMLSLDFEQLFPEDLTSEQKESALKSYQGLFDSLYQAVLSGDYNLDDIGGSLQQILSKGKFGELAEEGFEIALGEEGKQIVYTVHNGAVIKLADWSDKDTQNILKQYKDKTENKGLSTEQAQQQIQEAIKNYNAGRGKTDDNLTIEEILRIQKKTYLQHDKRGDYVYDENGNKIYNDNKEGGNPQKYAEILAKKMFKDQLGDSQYDNIEYDADKHQTTTTVTYGKTNTIKFKVKMNTETGEMEYSWDDDDSIPELKGYDPENGGKFNTQEELLDDLYKYVVSHGFQDDEGNSIEFPSKEAWVWQRFGIHYKIKPEVTKDGETVDDPSKDPKFRKTAKDAIDKLTEGYNSKDLGIGEYAKTGDGKVKVNLGDGYELTVNEEDVTVNGEVDQKLLQEKINEALGIDQGLKDTISAAIKEGLAGAITDLATQLTSLGENNSFTNLINSLRVFANSPWWATIDEKIQNLIDKLGQLNFPTPSDSSDEENPDDGENPSEEESKAETNGTEEENEKNGEKKSIETIGEITELNTEKLINNKVESVAEISEGQLKEGIDNPKIPAEAEFVSGKETKDWIKPEVPVQGEIQEAAQGENYTPAEVEAFGKITSASADLPSPPEIEVAGKLSSVDPSGVTAPEVEVQGKLVLDGGGEGGEGASNVTATVTWNGEEGTGYFPGDMPAKVTWTGERGDGYFPGDMQAYVTWIGKDGGGYKPGDTGATGNFGLAVGNFAKAVGSLGIALVKGQGRAMSTGTPTLMGELGPELVVANGTYRVVGQGGPEMVPLPKDAIVFNHIQTEQLLTKGMSKERGRAVTNERNAVSFAKGNINGGPAHASASAALAALKQLRSMWVSLKSASAKDLAGLGGSGGGGGGKNKDGKGKVSSSFLKDLEKWYNWLQEIATLEEKITYQEKLRSVISSAQKKNGKAYYASQKKSLEDLQKQALVEKDLYESQEKQFNKRRKELNKQSAFSSLYTFDENGQLKYNTKKRYKLGGSGKKVDALTFLSDLQGQNSVTGKANYTSAEQYSILQKAGFGEYLKYDSSGSLIDQSKDDWQSKAVQAFWDKIDADKEEMQTLHDSVNEHKEAVLGGQEKQNKLIQEIRDNQKEVEQSIYDAIVDSRDRAIQDAEDEKEAISDSANKFVKGLQNALDKEKEMYETQESEDELNKDRRKLAILMRTGGSGSEIASLQESIRSSEQDLYFDKQQEQIDAIQEASDKQIEKLDQQIQLQQELLDYEKAHGLLWEQVYQLMNSSAPVIADFIMNNNSEWWEKSPLVKSSDLEQTLFQADQWVSFRDDQSSYLQQIIDTISQSDGTETEAASTTATDKAKKKASTKSKYSVKYTNKKGKKQTRYFKTQEGAETFADTKTNSKITEAKYHVYARTAGKDSQTKSWGPYFKSVAESRMKSLKSKDEKKGNKSEYKSDKWVVSKTLPTGYSTGGLNTYTGLAVLHGTKTHPEAVLNSKQTEVLREQILSNKPTSLLNLLSSFRDAMAETATADTYSSIQNNTNGIEIGSVAVNMDVKSLANDYDARRAGTQVMEEMLRIARKSTTASVGR